MITSRFEDVNSTTLIGRGIRLAIIYEWYRTKVEPQDAAAFDRVGVVSGLGWTRKGSYSANDLREYVQEIVLDRYPSGEIITRWMSTNNIFTDSKDVQIGNHATIQSISGNATTNIYHSNRGDLVDLYGSVYRKIPVGDIIVRRNVSNQIIEVAVEALFQGITPGTSHAHSRVTKVRKTVQHAEILGLQGSFTSITVELVDGAQGDFETISQRVCRELASRRSPLFPQLVGMGWSEQPTWIVHDNLANGKEFIDQILAERNGVVSHYLWYTICTSVFALNDDKTLTLPLSADWGLWMFNLRTHAWQYDIPAISLSPPNIDLSLQPITIAPTPLRQETPPQLQPTEIIAFIENQFGDFLHAIASSGFTRHVEDLSGFARHGRLTFGTVVNRNNPKILAHLPSIYPPQWDFKNWSTGVEAVYSTTVCITDICFSLVGTIYKGPPSSPPIYLFVPPVPVEQISGIYSIWYPLVSPPFYWSFDPNGRQAIPENDWEKHGVSGLKVLSWIGSSWTSWEYDAVYNHLQTKNHEFDGRRYAQDRGYLELIQGDPHDQRISELKESDMPKVTDDSNSPYTSNTRTMKPKQSHLSGIVKNRRRNPRIARYIQIITTRRQSSRRFMRTTRGSKASSPASSNGARANKARKQRKT
ncbi:hypothetical protein PQX77_017448 [Marasmius sp. AFHP31]|nr:hypothetical protein PQX77_017448 [Marasmius sp. AFHP31]